MTDDEKTRSGIAAYDCGEYQILSNTLIALVRRLVQMDLNPAARVVLLNLDRQLL